MEFDYDGKVRREHFPYDDPDKGWKVYAEDMNTKYNNLVRVYNALHRAVMSNSSD